MYIPVVQHLIECLNDKMRSFTKLFTSQKIFQCQSPAMHTVFPGLFGNSSSSSTSSPFQSSVFGGSGNSGAGGSGSFSSGGGPVANTGFAVTTPQSPGIL